MQNTTGNKFYNPKGWFAALPFLSPKQRPQDEQTVGQVDKAAAGTATEDVSQPTTPDAKLKSDKVLEDGTHTPSVREGAAPQPDTPKSILKSNEVSGGRKRALDGEEETEPKRVRWDDRLVQIKWT